MKRATKETVKHLCEVLEVLKGNRGRKDVNPYLIPEVREALKHLARLQGWTEENCGAWLEAETDWKKLKTRRYIMCALYQLYSKTPKEIGDDVEINGPHDKYGYIVKEVSREKDRILYLIRGTGSEPRRGRKDHLPRV